MVPTEKLRQAVSDYKNGDAQAFTLLYQESDKYIYTCIYKVMQGMIMQRISYQISCRILMLRSVKISDRLKTKNAFLQWAGMIATRKCYAYLKRGRQVMKNIRR